MKFLEKIARNTSFWDFSSKSDMYMVQNTKNDQKSIFLAIFMENVTSMTPFKIGFYIEMVSRVIKKNHNIKKFHFIP